MKYKPVIKSAKQQELSILGNYKIVLYEEIKPNGPINYAYIIAVLDHKSQEACLYIASEVNAAARDGDDCSHFLGIFNGDDHDNLGASDEWGDKDLFTAEAMRIVNDRLGDGLSGPPKRALKPWEENFSDE